jgi:hypothetical protein
MRVRSADGPRLRWWEIAGLLAAVSAGQWGRIYRRIISAEEMRVVVGIVVLGIAVARPWTADAPRTQLTLAAWSPFTKGERSPYPTALTTTVIAQS